MSALTRPLTLGLCIALVTLALPARADAPAEVPWWKKFELGAFVDANFGWNFNNPKPAGASTGLAVHRMAGSGFAIAWAGGDLSYPPEPVGGTISLRFGPLATELGGKDTEVSLHYLQQAFVSYSPIASLRLDLGKFTTLYGFEVCEAQYNFNYTRGLVFWMLQPTFHAGLKVSWAITDAWTLNGLVANGWDNTVDFNSGKSGGVQVHWTPTGDWDVALGYLFGPEQPDATSVTCDPGTHYDPATGQCEVFAGAPGETVNVELEGANTRFRHLVDIYASYQATSWLKLGLNADFVAESVLDDNDQQTTMLAYGVMLAAQFNICQYFGAALRGEYVGDPDGWSSGTPDLNMFSATATLEGRATSHFTARLETRVDIADQSLFRRGLSDWNRIQVVTILGVIVSI